MSSKPQFQSDIDALGKVLTALSSLDAAAQQWVLNTAAGRLNVPTTSVPAATGGSIPKPPGVTLPNSDVKSLSAKEFLRQKSPKSDVDRVACLAFYLTYARDVSAFSSRDLTVVNTESAGPKI